MLSKESREWSHSGFGVMFSESHGFQRAFWLEIIESSILNSRLGEEKNLHITCLLYFIAKTKSNYASPSRTENKLLCNDSEKPECIS